MTWHSETVVGHCSPCGPLGCADRDPAREEGGREGGRERRERREREEGERGGRERREREGEGEGR